MFKPVSILLLLFVLACGSSVNTSRPANVPKPDVEIRTGQLFFGSGTTAPLPLDVLVHNGSAQPIVVRRIRVESPGMTQYGIYPFERLFRETIEPGATESFPLNPTAVASAPRMHPSEPLILRAWIDFEAGENRWREMYMLR